VDGDNVTITADRCQKKTSGEKGKGEKEEGECPLSIILKTKPLLKK